MSFWKDRMFWTWRSVRVSRWATTAVVRKVSALDAIAEQALYESFDEMIGDKSAVYISHRLASTRFCDRIAMFEEGHLVEYGTHAELEKIEGGIYAQMFEAQAKYYRD